MRGSPNREWRSEEVAEENQVRTVQAVESQRTEDGYTQGPVVIMSWYGDGPPLASPSASSPCGDPNDPTWTLYSLSFVIQQLSSLLLQTSSPLSSPVTILTRHQLVGALSNVAFTSLQLTSIPCLGPLPSTPHTTASPPPQSHTPPSSSSLSSAPSPSPHTVPQTASLFHSTTNELPSSPPSASEQPSPSPVSPAVVQLPPLTIRVLTQIAPLSSSARHPTINTCPKPHVVSRRRAERRPHPHSCPTSPAPSPAPTSPNPFAALSPPEDDECVTTSVKAAPHPSSPPPSPTVSSPAPVTAAAEVVLDSADALNASLPQTHNASGAPTAALALPLGPVSIISTANTVITTKPVPAQRTSTTTTTLASLSSPEDDDCASTSHRPGSHSPHPSLTPTPTPSTPPIIASVPVSVSAPAVEVAFDSAACLNASQTQRHNASGTPSAGSALPLDPIAPATAGTAATLTPLPSSIVTSAPVSVSAPAAEVALDSVDRLNASQLSTHNASDAPIAAPALPVNPVAPVLAAAVLSAPKPKLKTSSTTRTPVSLSPTTSSQTPARSLNPAPTPALTPVAPETRLTRSQTQPVHRFFQQLLSRTSTQRQHFQRHYLSNASMCCCQEFPVYSSKILLSSSEMRLPPELDHLCLLCVFALCSCLGPQMQSMLLHWRPDIASEIETYYAQFYTNDESLAIASSITPHSSTAARADRCRQPAVRSAPDGETQSAVRRSSGGGG